jgi:energy-coupling factor transporter ATP-binding protein EcfA2
VTEVNRLCAEIEDEPARLDEYAAEMQTILESGNTEERQAVAEMLQEIVRERGSPSRSVLGRHTALLDTAVHDDDPTVRRFGALATALVADEHPETVTEFVDALVEAYPSGPSYSEQALIIRALGTIGHETNTSLDQYDAWFAELLHDGEGLAPKEIAVNIGNIVVDAPHKYPITVQALVAVLDEADSETRTNAMLVVALIAQEDVTALPLVGWETLGISPVVLGGHLGTQLFASPVWIGIMIDPVILGGGLGVLTLYWQVGRTEYQLRHRLYDDIMVVPLKDSGDRHGDPTGSWRAVQLETDRSVLALGETGSGKTEAIKVLAAQLQADPDEPFVIFDYKQDYQTFFEGDHVVRLSSEDSDVIWNVFGEIEEDEDCDEIAKSIFAGAETDNDYFTNAATQVLADVFRLLRQRSDPSVTMTNRDLISFLNKADVDTMRKGFILEDLSAQKHLPAGVEASSNIASILEERVKAVFRGNFAEGGDFSVRDYMANPRGRILILDFPIQQSSSVQPIFRLLIDWSIRFGLEDERGSYYLLDEFAALPKLDMLERLINAGRAYNCYAILGVQAIPQLHDTYGKDGADSLLSGLAQEIHLRVGQGSVEYCRKRLGRNRVERNVGNDDDDWLTVKDKNDQRVFEEYPVGEDTLQNLDAGRGVVHTTAGRQWGRLYMLDDIEGRLLPVDRLRFHERIAARLGIGQLDPSQPELEPTADRDEPTPRLEEES